MNEEKDHEKSEEETEKAKGQPKSDSDRFGDEGTDYITFYDKDGNPIKK